MMFRVLLLSEMAKNPRVGVYLVFAVARLYRELSAFTAVFSENRRCFFRRFAAANPLFIADIRICYRFFDPILVRNTFVNQCRADIKENPFHFIHECYLNLP